MSTKSTESPAMSLIEAVDKLFLRFLVGKNKIYKEEDYNDGLTGADIEDGPSESKSLDREDGWNQRILLDVEKQRVIREEADKRLIEKRNALLMRYFQQSLLKVIHSKLEDRDAVILEQLQLHSSTIELLKTLLSGEPRYSTLAALLDQNLGTKKRLLSLVGSEDFMGALGRTSRHVRDIQSAVGLVGTEVLRYLVPAILLKYQVNTYAQHNVLFVKKLWRYEMTLGQTCTALMIDENYRRPYEGMLLSAMVNFGYVASYQQYLSSFEEVRTTCLDQAREKGEKSQHDFFYDIQTDSASLQALLVSQSNLKLSLSLSEKLFSDSFPHLVNALREQVNSTPFEQRSKHGKILFKALRFAKYDSLRASRLFKAEWLNQYLTESEIGLATYKSLHRRELFRFKPTW